MHTVCRPNLNGFDASQSDGFDHTAKVGKRVCHQGLSSPSVLHLPSKMAFIVFQMRRQSDDQIVSPVVVLTSRPTAPLSGKTLTLADVSLLGHL